jgi:DNA-binding NarL/FixJ family response regulator
MEPKETKQSIVPKISHKNLPHNNLKEELSAEIDDKVINLRNKNKEILRLINKGMSDREIARRLNLGLGEIQLVMNLHRKVIGK